MDFTMAKRMRFKSKLNTLRHPCVTQTNIGRVDSRRRMILLDELGKHFLFVWLCVSSIKTSSTRIIRLEELQMQSQKKPPSETMILIIKSATSAIFCVERPENAQF